MGRQQRHSMAEHRCRDRPRECLPANQLKKIR